MLADVGVGFNGLICGWVRGLAVSSNCSLEFDPSCNVREPSDHRLIRAFDWVADESLGDVRHRIVLFDVLYAEKVEEGVLEEWWSVVGGSKLSKAKALGLMPILLGKWSKYSYIWSANGTGLMSRKCCVLHRHSAVAQDVVQ